MQDNINSYDIPTIFLNMCADSLSSWFSESFNKCIEKGEFPKIWKIAKNYTHS